MSTLSKEQVKLKDIFKDIIQELLEAELIRICKR